MSRKESTQISSTFTMDDWQLIIFAELTISVSSQLDYLPPINTIFSTKDSPHLILLLRLSKDLTLDSTCRHSY